MLANLGASRGLLTNNYVPLSGSHQFRFSRISLPRNDKTSSRCLPPPPAALPRSIIHLPTCQAGRPSGGQRRPSSSQPRRFRKQGENSSNATSSSNGKQRLNKALAATGVASRRGADEMIFAGRVAVNGSVVKEPGIQIDLSKDKLALDGKVVSTMAANKKYYFALNKPKGYICSNKGDGSEGSGDRLVIDLFEEWLKGWKYRHPGSGAPPRLFTVGRLDVASVGLVFITNDGDWAQSIQHPSSELTKEYSITLNRRPGKVEMEALTAGCMLDGSQVNPIAVAFDDSDASKQHRIRMILAEGKNREVRRLAEAAGMEVRQLRRIRVGGYRLPRGLQFGQFVELRPWEIRRVLDKGADRNV
ncbi:putative ribosomal large subunit pseudouridine synthase SVR1, chloroplastic [Nannochloris sp. 'desiccata']|nr:putative ribosomal large subunit pseudouridine synthase SVR1, chloroplastic [Chlorella desiccata (nom. nud.)]